MLSYLLRVLKGSKYLCHAHHFLVCLSSILLKYSHIIIISKHFLMKTYYTTVFSYIKNTETTYIIKWKVFNTGMNVLIIYFYFYCVLYKNQLKFKKNADIKREF